MLSLFPTIFCVSFVGNTGSSVTGCTGNEVDKQIGIWERRVKGLRRLLLGWDQARPPDAPASVTVDVTGENSIQVQILEPFDGAIGTKFKGKYTHQHSYIQRIALTQIHTHTKYIVYVCVCVWVQENEQNGKRIKMNIIGSYGQQLIA